MKITVDMAIAEMSYLDYTRETLEELWNWREFLTPPEVSELSIHILDRYWLLRKIAGSVDMDALSKMEEQCLEDLRMATYGRNSAIAVYEYHIKIMVDFLESE
jgi:hypothetical protein